MVERSWAEAVEEIKSRLDIIDVISKHVILKKRGQNYIGLCPFHNEKTPSFIVSPQKGIFKCFGCNKGGDAITFLMEIHNASYTDTIRELAQQFNIELPKGNSNYEKNNEKRTKIYEAITKAKEFYTYNLLNSKEAKKSYEYLQNRGITDEIINQYGLGYSLNSYESLENELKEYSPEILESAGLIIKREGKIGYYDRFRERIMIPIFDEKGQTVAFGSRTLNTADNAKYINSPDSFIYNKSKILYGFNFAKDAIKTKDYVLIMEGYFDVITAQVNGVKNAVASCGTALTPEHVKLISRYCPSRRIYLAFDTDNAGQNATNRGAEIIKQEFESLGDIKQFGSLGVLRNYDEMNSGLDDDRFSCEIRVVSPPDGKDPDEYIREHGGEKYIEHIQRAPLLMDYKLDKILKQKTPDMSPTEKLKLVKEIYPIIGEISNKIVQNEYIKIVATALQLSESALTQELKKYSSTKTYTLKEYTPNVTRNVTKSSNLLEKSQKNLLSLYLTKEGLLQKELLSEALNEIDFLDENLKKIKETIDKLSFTVNNIVDLTESLYTEFAEDNDKKDIITDLICLSDTFKGLSSSDFALAVRENISNIERYNKKRIKDELILQNKKVVDDEQEIEYQKQLAEKLKKLKTGEY